MELFIEIATIVGQFLAIYLIIGFLIGLAITTVEPSSNFVQNDLPIFGLCTVFWGAIFVMFAVMFFKSIFSSEPTP